jgi:uncharacterized membrane protein
MAGQISVAGLVVTQMMWNSSCILWWFWMTLIFLGALMLIVAVSFALYGVTHCPQQRFPGLHCALKAARRRCAAGEISREDYRRIRRSLRAGPLMR